MDRITVFAMVMILAVLGNCLCALAADQPCWRGANRDGKSAETGLLKQWPEGGPKLLWEVNTIGRGYSTISVSDGVIYATGDVGDELVVFAFDLNGKVKWHEKAVGKGSLCYADGMLYLFGERGGKAVLAAFSPDGMEIKGSVTVAGSGPSWAHPVVAGGRLYLRYAENLYCFDVSAK